MRFTVIDEDNAGPIFTTLDPELPELPQVGGLFGRSMIGDVVHLTVLFRVDDDSCDLYTFFITEAGEKTGHAAEQTPVSEVPAMLSEMGFEGKRDWWRCVRVSEVTTSSTHH